MQIKPFSLQLAFSDDTLYGHVSSGSGFFYTVDLATGVATQLTLSGAGKLYTDLASGPREPECGQVTVFKYYDIDQNRMFDADDYGLEYWEFYLNGARLLTDEDGYADFGCLPPGTYTVCETLKDGWVNSEPGDGTACKEITVSPGDNITVEFGNFEKVKIPPPSQKTPSPTVGVIVMPVNKAGLLLPWIVFTVVIAALLIPTLLRRVIFVMIMRKTSPGSINISDDL